MGVDIHMTLISKDGEVIAKDLYNGRNGEWFDNISKRCYRNEDYDEFPVYFGIPDNCPEKIKKIYDGVQNNDENYFGYYDFCYVSVRDFFDWGDKVKPELHAGWVSKHCAWKIKNKGYIPDEEEVWTTLPKDAIIQDWEFIEWRNKYDCSFYLNQKIVELAKKDDRKDFDKIFDGYIVYYFDC